MDILWILWTIPAVIAVEGKLMFWFTGSQSHPPADSRGLDKTLPNFIVKERNGKGIIVGASAS